MFHYMFTKNDLDKLLDSMIELSDINPEMSLEELAHQVCDSISVKGYTSADICECLLYIIENDNIFEIKDGVLERCFISDIKEVKIPSSITSIRDRAFSYCSSLESVSIPDKVTSIGDLAFYNCSTLESITIGNGIRNIEQGTFWGCKSLKNMTIPENVTSIGISAFRECSSLENIIIPNSVTSIADYAFYRCTSLTNVTIPNSVRSIGDNAFTKCDKLLSINYEGTIEQWKSISKSPYWNYRIDTYIIHCTNGDIYL